MAVLAAHSVVLRIAWIFKTETVIMPAFLDAISGAGWLRGCLPILNGLGQSVPPMLFADRLERTPRKKWPLVAVTLLMAVPFALLAGIWFALGGRPAGWLPLVFLLLYLWFFCTTGLNVLSFGTLQGKLIRPERRGRLLAISGVVGAIGAIGGAALLLPQWLERPDGGFGQIFAVTAVGFLVSGLLCLAVVEPPDEAETRPPAVPNPLQTAWLVFRDDAEFRRLAVAAMLSVVTQVLFPHYQALGRERPGASRLDLMNWVIAQNAGTGLFSLIAGVVADRFGNRLTLRIEVFAAAFTPLFALSLAGRVLPGVDLFWMCFFLLGLTPVIFRTLVNYTLELVEPARHPRYLSTLRLCVTVPFAFAPLVGLLVDLVGFDAVFVVLAALIGCGGLLTFRMIEPRRRHLDRPIEVKL